MDFNERHLKDFPLYFSQVREDPRIDLQIIESFKGKVHVLMIASGGCTAAVLARHPQVETIDAVDINPSQIHLSKCKLLLLEKSRLERGQLLGHFPMENRLEELISICSPEFFGRLDAVNEFGPDYVGRYEWLFRDFSSDFQNTPFGKTVRKAKSFEEQKKCLQQDLSSIQALFEKHFSLDRLVRLFGDAATQNRKKPFAEHFFDRFLWSLNHQFIHTNPFFFQFAYLQHPLSSSSMYLNLKRGKPIDVHFYCASMEQYLTQAQSNSIDYIHLSNILDWAASCEEILGEAARVLKPGGKVSVRQLNSTMQIKSTQSLAFTKRSEIDDLSFFYPNIYIGEKR